MNIKLSLIIQMYLRSHNKIILTDITESGEIIVRDL